MLELAPAVPSVPESEAAKLETRTQSTGFGSDQDAVDDAGVDVQCRYIFEVLWMVEKKLRMNGQ